MNEILHAVFNTEGFVLGTLVPFLFVLTVVVFVHEMGHWPAVRHRCKSLFNRLWP